MTLDARSLMARGGALDGVSALSAELLRGPRQRRALEIDAEKQAEAQRRQAVMDLLAEQRGARADELHGLQVEALRAKADKKPAGKGWQNDPNGGYFRTDEDGNLVVVEKGGKITKFGADGTPIAVTTGGSTGEPSATPTPPADPAAPAQVEAGAWPGVLDAAGDIGLSIVKAPWDLSAAGLRAAKDVATSPFMDIRRSGTPNVRTLGDYMANPALLSLDAASAAGDYLANLHLVGTGATPVRPESLVRPAPPAATTATTDQQAAIIGRIAGNRAADFRLPSGRRAIPQDEMGPDLLPAEQVPAGAVAPAPAAAPVTAAAPVAATRGKVSVAKAALLPKNVGKTRAQIIADIQANGYTPVE